MQRINTVLVTCLGASLLSLVPVGDAEAAPRAKGADGKRFRLHIDTDALGFTHVNPDGDDGPDNVARQNNLGFGIGRLSLTDGTINSLGIGFGYAFLDSRAIVGARFSLVVDGQNLGEDGKTTNFRSQFQPYFQWMFLPGRWVRPYVEARVGIGGSVTTSVDDPGPGETTRRVNNSMFPFGGVGGGVHLFPVDYFSVDLGLNLTMAGLYGKEKVTVGDTTMKGDWDNQAFVLNLAAMVGVSTWF